MKEVRLPVAAPMAGYFVGIYSDKTAWQEHSDSFRALLKPRMFYTGRRPYIAPKKEKK
jgi:hypothetical protein